MKQKEIFINKKQWSLFTGEEKGKYMEKVFQYYRENGFPYFPATDEFRAKELSALQKYDYRKCIDLEAKVIKQSMHSLSFCWSFHPYHYEIKCQQMKTPYEVFHNDALFRKVIEKRMRMGDNMSDNGIRKMLKVFTGTQCVSNFRPTAAACVYELFSQPNDVVLDMSFGFGGRMLGAFLTKRKYIGFDPSTKAMEGNQAMKNFLMRFDCSGVSISQNDTQGKGGTCGEKEITRRKKEETCGDKRETPNEKITLFNQGSEIPFDLPANSIDLCFTSPPYFDCEKYTEESTQSYLKFPTQQTWLNDFLGATFENCHYVLKPNKFMVINIQNVKTFPTLVEETKNLALAKGFQLFDEWKLSLSQLGTGGYKFEPILVFIKIGS